MRSITHGDVIAAASALMSWPERSRRSLIVRFLEQAHIADIYRKRTGRVHPVWGNGTLMAAVLQNRALPTEPSMSDSAYLNAVSIVIEALLSWRQRANTS